MDQRDIILACLRYCIKIEGWPPEINKEDLEKTIAEVENFQANF